ncbi:hypothetical protein QUV93_08410 [Phascolarctobacterium faecium]|nr:hypothetical protein [Phascolarctobacterium faecium]MDM8109883.1 hypothetical protein [Phascolarctobacterium faecium]
MMGLIDWVEDFTGKTERDRILHEMNNLQNDVKKTLETGIKEINKQIEELNININKLNLFRENSIKNNLIFLDKFLQKFGFVDKNIFFREENNWSYSKKNIALINDIEEYKNKYDLDGSLELLKAAFGAIYLHFKRQKENVRLNAELGRMRHEYEKLKNDLKYQKQFYKENNEIALLYMICLNEIHLTIVNIILPEFETVEAFCQVLELKNKVINDEDLENIVFKNRILALQGTDYDKHYRFIKNAYAFYVISLKIYNTPILSNLFNSKFSKSNFSETENELKYLEERKNILLKQKDNLIENLIMERSA